MCRSRTIPHNDRRKETQVEGSGYTYPESCVNDSTTKEVRGEEEEVWVLLTGPPVSSVVQTETMDPEDW